MVIITNTKALTTTVLRMHFLFESYSLVSKTPKEITPTLWSYAFSALTALVGQQEEHPACIE